VSTYRLLVSIRLILAIVGVSVLGFPAKAQSMSPFAHGISHMPGEASGPAETPLGCNDASMNAASACRESAYEFDTSTPAPSNNRGGAISADELRHPLSGKARRALQKVMTVIQAGDHARAVEQLREVVKIPSAAPYAHSLLGQEYLQLGKTIAALPELEEAVRLLPSDVPDRADLGLALLVTGDTQRAEQELRHALQMDPNNVQTKVVLGEALLENGVHNEEALTYLHAAAVRLPVAHAVLAAYYAHAGQRDAAEREARAFLGTDYDASAVRGWVEMTAGQRLGFSLLNKSVK
jgi:tetratricopeptide (TPR) repeat protein